MSDEIYAGSGPVPWDNEEEREWVQTRPTAVQKVIWMYPPNTCWLLRDASGEVDMEGHYEITGYHESNGVVTWVYVEHGRDSYMPGLRVFQVTLDMLVHCGCGKWERATPEQMKQTAIKVDERARRMRSRRGELN